MGRTSTIHRTRSVFVTFLVLIFCNAAYAQSCLREPSEFIVEESGGKCRLILEYPEGFLPNIFCGQAGSPNGATGATLTYFAIEDDYLGTIVFYNAPANDCSQATVTALQYGSSENTLQTAYAPQICDLQYSRRITTIARYLDGSESICEPDNPNPLPVEWVSFIAEGHNNRTVQLKWAVADQLNNSHFEVQHSTDGASFRTIDVIRGDGTLSGFKAFNYFHNSPKYGRNYYRLRQVDFDGTYDFSEVSFVDLDFKKVANIFPSVIFDHNNIGIEIDADRQGLADIHIVDMNGAIISSSSIAVDEGLSLNRIDIPSALTAGLYFVHVQLDGNRLESHKLIKVSP